MGANRHTFLTVSELKRLNWACYPLLNAYENQAIGLYLVGSSLERTDYFDIDARMILEDKHFKRRYAGNRERLLYDNTVHAEHLARATDLAIDFQFQSFTECHEYDGRPRHPVGLHL